MRRRKRKVDEGERETLTAEAPSSQLDFDKGKGSRCSTWIKGQIKHHGKHSVFRRKQITAQVTEESRSNQNFK